MHVTHARQRVPVVLIVVLQRVLVVPLLVVLGQVRRALLRLAQVPAEQRAHLQIRRVGLVQLGHALRALVRRALAQRDVRHPRVGFCVVCVPLQQALVHLLGLVGHVGRLVRAAQVVANRGDQRVRVILAFLLLAGPDARAQRRLEHRPRLVDLLVLEEETAHVVEEGRGQVLAEHRGEFLLIPLHVRRSFFRRYLGQLHLLQLREALHALLRGGLLIQPREVHQNRLIRRDLLPSALLPECTHRLQQTGGLFGLAALVFFNAALLRGKDFLRLQGSQENHAFRVLSLLDDLLQSELGPVVVLVAHLHLHRAELGRKVPLIPASPGLV